MTYLARRCLLLFLLASLFFPLWSVASAQTCSGFVAVDGTMLEDDAACYFTAAEGAEHAYIRTDLLTAALGLESDYLPETGTLRFKKAGRTVDLAATDDVDAALSRKPEALRVDGQRRASRSAVLAGSSYLPLAEIVRAFGGDLDWNGVASLVMVDFSDPLPEAVTPLEPDIPVTAAPEPTEAEGAGASGTLLGAPRYGVHEGYTRVAVEVPAKVPYRLAVDDKNFVVLFGSARAEPYTLTPDGAQLSSLGYAQLGDGAVLALIVGTHYRLSADGKGFEVGTVAADAGGKTLYIDFAPARRGERVENLSDLALERLATVKRPANVQKTVVIDPGHGGHDPGAGTESGYVVEKDLVLSVGLLLKEALEARGVRVEMTRDDDTFVELEDRARFAVPSKHNLFISLHANATETAGAEGIETWVFGEPQDAALIALAVLENGGGEVGRERTARAQADVASIDGDLLLEENLSYSTQLAEIVQHDLVDLTGSEDRGIKKNSFVVIGDARVPAVLVELGFVNHPVEGPRLADVGYQKMLAEALADGVEAFLERGGALASSAPRTGSE